ncbi:KTSC domain-containing protein [Oceanotoga teriensis]|uniref:KTSC domain-containing protein n=1 Tax=Oceanotoga teriensis TaxID=515440 RepID=UPI002712882B|nr:KTSC domain-containing protein [Oceanotoga teriensis]MDO7977728.1 KTSC domain-containing protein [Oceanotoga teriensis]
MKNIEMVFVESSNLLEVGYDENNELLYVRFKNNSLYFYKGVPKFQYETLLNSQSVGRYFANNIRNFYPYEKIE